MDFLFVLKKFLTACVLPPTSLLLLLLLGLIFIKRWPRTALAAIWISFISLFVLSLPVTSHALNAALDAPKLDQKAFKQVKAIIVLGGGVRLNTPEDGDVLSSASFERLRYGVKLARATGIPLLVTGGSVYGGVAEGDVMARVTKQDFGYETHWIENHSRDTRENMTRSAELLKPEHIKHVLIVTHDIHMRRAMAYCRAAGFECWAAPVSSHGSTNSWIEQLPSAVALENSAAAIHEFLGIWFLKYA